MILLALGACSATTTGPTVAPTVASFGPGGHGGTLTGSGSTFDAPGFDTAFTKYHQQHPAASISYAAVGSSAGIAAFSAKQVNFGASDVPMTASEQAAATGGPSVQVPVVLGAEAVAFNLSLPSGQRLHLTGPVIARIFLGQITHWNNPAITALNPASTSPARRSPSFTAPTAAAPPTSSATTSPAPTPPGRPRSAPAKPSTGRSGKAPKATPASPPRSSGPPSLSDTSKTHTPVA